MILFIMLTFVFYNRLFVFLFFFKTRKFCYENFSFLSRSSWDFFLNLPERKKNGSVDNLLFSFEESREYNHLSPILDKFLVDALSSGSIKK
jgi:hypothetical protein